MEAKVAARAPTSAMICCAESTPRPGTSVPPLDCILMLPEQTCHLLVQLADPLLDQLQLFERHLHQPAVDRVELRARTPCIAPLRRRGAQALVDQGGQISRISFPSANACSIRRALAPSRSETKLDNLIWASSSSAYS